MTQPRILTYDPTRLIATIVLACLTQNASAAPVFEIDVMAAFSKASCNSGTCHGNQNGKGGFKLSLRGQDAKWDHRRLVKELSGRRINPFAPEQSLILQKPTARLPHGGGRRFLPDSPPYQVIRDWIASGAKAPHESNPKLVRLEVSPTNEIVIQPNNEVQIRATAHFNDGTSRDITNWAVYETVDALVSVTPDGSVQCNGTGETTIIVRYLQRQVPVSLAFIPPRSEFAWNDPPVENYIDHHVDTKLQALRMTPSHVAGDSTFVRRVFLDVLGVLPTADESREFITDHRPDKRERLIDQLVARPEFADHWTLKWSDLLRNEEKVLDPTGVKVYHTWIRDSINDGKPINQFVRELMMAGGSTYSVPAANFWRASRDPFTRAESTSRLFLGTRLLCAKCHNHPFERWTQHDYYSWAAFFSRIDYEVMENRRKDRLDKNEFNGEQFVVFNESGEVTNPQTQKTAEPRFLGSNSQASARTSDRHFAMAEWLTSRENRAFAKSQANFVWYHLMGRGLVEPIDDFRLTNPPINPPLMEALADDFVKHGFDLRQLVRRIVASRSYQVSARPNTTNSDDEQNFSRAIVRRLTAEQLLDSQSQVLDLPAEFAGYDEPIRAGQMSGVQRVRKRDGDPEPGDQFLMTFGKSQRQLACECERSNETNLKQAFTFVCGDPFNGRLSKRDGRLERLASEPSSDKIINNLFWTALSRAPNKNEIEVGKKILDAQGTKRFEAVQDLAWALMNSKEFVFRK